MSTEPDQNRQIVVASLPTGALEAANFDIQATPVPEPGPGHVLCRTLAITIGAGRRSADARRYPDLGLRGRHDGVRRGRPCPVPGAQLDPAYADMPAPGLGQHTDEVLTELLGYDTTKIDRLRADAIVR